MSQPVATDLLVQELLQEAATAYLQKAEGFGHRVAFPNVVVQQEDGKYRTYNKDNFRRDEDARWRPGRAPQQIGWEVTDASYSCESYAWDVPVTQDQRTNNSGPMSLDMAAGELLAQKALIRMEREWVTNFFSTSVWGTDNTLTGTNQWSDEANSDPEANVNTAKETILKETGFMANVGVIDYTGHNVLKQHPSVQDRFKYTTAESITKDMLARYFELDRYECLTGSYDSAGENETASEAFIAGDNMLIVHAPSSPSLLNPSGGYQFIWGGLTGQSGAEVAVSIVRDEVNEATLVRGKTAFDQVAVATDLGYFINDLKA